MGQGSRFFLTTAMVLEHILRSSSPVGAQRGLKMQPQACTEEILWILCWFQHTSYFITTPNTFRHTFRCLQCEPQEKEQERNCITLLHVTVHSFFLAVFPLIRVRAELSDGVWLIERIVFIVYKTQKFSSLLEITCGLHPSIEKAEAISTGSTYRSNVTFVCSSGYHLVGPQNITCLANGSWSKPLPLCEGKCLGLFPVTFQSGISNSSSLMHAYHIIQRLNWFW